MRTLILSQDCRKCKKPMEIKGCFWKPYGNAYDVFQCSKCKSACRVEDIGED